MKRSPVSCKKTWFDTPSRNPVSDYVLGFMFRPFAQFYGACLKDADSAMLVMEVCKMSIIVTGAELCFSFPLLLATPLFSFSKPALAAAILFSFLRR